ncbi:MAG: hypothetical protein KME13_18540 [Myxacorys californica WJT36-NPBG1]|jgi:hypothetical protein|nr:hypothetical protein [Myxacorys californica WJT36-NPBG1]
MKLPKEIINQAFNILSTDTNSSVRSISKKLNIPFSTLKDNLIKQYGNDYRVKAKGADGSLYKILKAEYKNKPDLLKWLEENKSALIKDDSILSNSQLNRLTRNECSHSKNDYRTIFEYSTFMNEKLEQQRRPTEEVIQELPSYDESRIKTSYIDPVQLLRVLEDYYNGTLNECDKFIPNIYKPLSQLNPGSSLWSQIDESLMSDAIGQLNFPQCLVLNFKITNDPSVHYRIGYIFTGLNTSETFEDYIDRLCLEAFDVISDYLLTHL